MFKVIFFMLLALSTSLFANTSSSLSNLFPLLMLNLTQENIYISLQQDIGLVFFDEELEDHTLVSPGLYSNIFGVNFAPRDPKSRFKMIFDFDNENQCVFTVSYFRFPDTPKVAISGAHCAGAGYRVELASGYEALVLYVGLSAHIE